MPIPRHLTCGRDRFNQPVAPWLQLSRVCPRGYGVHAHHPSCRRCRVRTPDRLAGGGSGGNLRSAPDRRARGRRGRSRRRSDGRGRQWWGRLPEESRRIATTSSPLPFAAAPGGPHSGSTSARTSTPAGRGSPPATGGGCWSPGCRSSESAPTACSRPRSIPAPSEFQAPVPVDFNVGEATSTFPDLAMNPGGQAYLTYVVVTDTSTANPPGYVGGAVRVARYNNRLWSLLGSPVNRNPATPVRLPTERAAHGSGSTLQGNGVVAWQEPDDEFVDRVWARRLFGTNVGISLQVSPSTWEGAPLRGAGRRLRARRRRLRPGGGRLPPAARPVEQADSAPRLFVNEMTGRFRQRRFGLQGARLVDGGGPGRPGRTERRRRTQRRLRRRLRRPAPRRCSGPATWRSEPGRATRRGRQLGRPATRWSTSPKPVPRSPLGASCAAIRPGRRPGAARRRGDRARRH